MNLERETLKKLIQQLLEEESGGLDCSECCDVLDKFAELKLAGLLPAQEMPSVQEHLNHCETCREQFDMLCDALKSLGDELD